MFTLPYSTWAVPRIPIVIRLGPVEAGRAGTGAPGSPALEGVGAPGDPAQATLNRVSSRQSSVTGRKRVVGIRLSRWNLRSNMPGAPFSAVVG